MYKTISLIGGAGVGAGLMYILDPDRGKRRRALLRDKTVHWSRKTREMAGSTSRDMRNRAKGMTASFSAWTKPDQPVSDRVLFERIRSRLGMLSRHPASIEVQVKDGVVMLSGRILHNEVDNIVEAVGQIQGVVRVDNRLEPHQTPSDIPELQGTTSRQLGPRFELFQSNWSPTARFFTAIIGTAAIVYGMARRTMGAATLATSGLGLLVRSVTNREFVRLFSSS